jgi:hypothetical protein
VLNPAPITDTIASVLLSIPRLPVMARSGKRIDRDESSG